MPVPTAPKVMNVQLLSIKWVCQDND